MFSCVICVISLAMREQINKNIIDCIFFCGLLGCYDARMRTLAKFVSLMLQVDWEEVEEYENLVVKVFKEEEHVATE